MKSKLITAVRIKNLYGLYTYNLPESGQLSNAAILYGDNGVGKSTLLRLAFHLLSAANDRGHRTALFNTDFQRLEVDLHSGITLSAEPIQENDFRVLRLEISRKEKLLAIWDHFPKREQRSLIEDEDFVLEMAKDGKRLIRRRRKLMSKNIPESVAQGNEAYLSVLSDFVPTMFILNAERRLDSDTVSDPSDEMELRRFMHMDTPKRINELVVRSREIALSQALGSAAQWIRSKAIKGTNQGSMNVHSVYIDVLHHLLAPAVKNTENSEDNDDSSLSKKLADIESQMTKHAVYELATQLSTAEFQRALAKDKSKSLLAAELLQPYVKSLERRLEAVEPIYRIIDRFITTLNSFLRDKQLQFRLSQGFTIQNSLGSPLEPSQLSSGEQQLLLLFCYVLIARDNPSVFMIDEPEISLNIKWQRQLVQALLNIAEEADIQFIFASHSMELLAQHRDRVVKLSNIE